MVAATPRQAMEKSLNIKSKRISSQSCGAVELPHPHKENNYNQPATPSYSKTTNQLKTNHKKPDVKPL